MSTCGEFGLAREQMTLASEPRMIKTDDILEFWFNGINDDTIIDKKKPPFSRWFAVDHHFDQTILTRFESVWRMEQTSKIDEVELSSKNVLAYIILFDQFSRNMFRNTPLMFSTDPLALKLALGLIKEGNDRELFLIYRVFVYMPLMHAEDINIQRKSLECFEQLVEDSKCHHAINTHYFEYNLYYARQHYLAIEKFGRFPSRNSVLKRVSSSAEAQFLT